MHKHFARVHFNSLHLISFGGINSVGAVLLKIEIPFTVLKRNSRKKTISLISTTLEKKTFKQESRVDYTTMLLVNKKKRNKFNASGRLFDDTYLNAVNCVNLMK